MHEPPGQLSPLGVPSLDATCVSAHSAGGSLPSSLALATAILHFTFVPNALKPMMQEMPTSTSAVMYSTAALPERCDLRTDPCQTTVMSDPA